MTGKAKVSVWKIVLRAFWVGIPIGITFTDRVCYVARVDGTSMQPELNPASKSDYVLLCRLDVSEVRRGEVVSLINPRDPTQKLIKRVIGLPGDIIRSRSNCKWCFQRDGRSVDGLVRLDAGHCWVEGDHEQASIDSNSFGPVPLALVTGTAKAVLWPPEHFRILKPQLIFHRLPLNLSIK